MDDPFDLQRFVNAQNAHGTYEGALREIRAGHKSGHWMWFVFPQLAGLGRSSTARHYAINGLSEAQAYFAHPVLGPRLTECARALTALPDSNPVAIFGPLDAQKLRSSMTLFAHAASEPTPFAAVLDRYFGGESDENTTRLLSQAR